MEILVVVVFFNCQVKLTNCRKMCRWKIHPVYVIYAIYFPPFRRLHTKVRQGKKKKLTQQKTLITCICTCVLTLRRVLASAAIAVLSLTPKHVKLQRVLVYELHTGEWVSAAWSSLCVYSLLCSSKWHFCLSPTVEATHKHKRYLYLTRARLRSRGCCFKCRCVSRQLAPRWANSCCK